MYFAFVFFQFVLMLLGFVVAIVFLVAAGHPWMAVFLALIGSIVIGLFLHSGPHD